MRQHVAHHPNATLKERAQHFGVAVNAIWYALQQLNVRHTTNSAVRLNGTRPNGRRIPQQLRHLLTTPGLANVVYLDERGCERTAHRTHGWACKGHKVAGERSGNTRPRTSLLTGKCGMRLLAPMLFEGSTNSEWFNAWLKQHLLKELAPNSILIMDNAVFHKTAKTRELIHKAGHPLLFLPPYSLDFNSIEQDFATLKKRRQNAPPDTPLDDIIRTYGTYLE